MHRADLKGVKIGSSASKDAQTVRHWEPCSSSHKNYISTAKETGNGMAGELVYKLYTKQL